MKSLEASNESICVFDRENLKYFISWLKKFKVNFERQRQELGDAASVGDRFHGFLIIINGLKYVWRLLTILNEDFFEET